MLAIAVALLAAPASRAVIEPPPEPVPLGLYDWIGVASIVVAADVVADDSRYVRAIVKTPIRGGLSGGAPFQIDQRKVNREREEGVPALELTKGNAYVMLLAPSTRRTKDATPIFDLVRGVRGSMLLRVEGSAATIDAIRRLAEVQDRKNDDYLWTALPEFLQDANPVLVDAALDLYAKFRREGPAIAPLLQPLLEHPRPDFRRRAAALLGRVLLRVEAGDLPERPQLVAELTGRARRDEDASVRREATAALGALPEGSVLEVLRAISRDDPDQNVRFEAQRSLLKRSQAAPGARFD